MSRLGKIKERTKRQSRGWQNQLNAATYVNIEDIILDPRLQQRVETNQGVVEEYTQILKNGGELAAVSIINEEGKLWLWDGWHTIEAHQAAKRAQVKANIQRGTFRDAWIASLGANDKHGLRRKKEDKEKALKNALNDPKVQYSLLAEDGLHSFRSVAKWTGWSHPGVANYWRRERLPNIYKAIDEALQQENESLMTDKQWIAVIGKRLYIPAWLVEQRQVELEFKEEEEKKKRIEQEKLEAGNVTTRQPTGESESVVPVRESESSHTNLEAGKVTTRQLTGESESVVPVRESESSHTNLEAGKVTTRQLTGESESVVPVRESESSHTNLEAGKVTTRQLTSESESVVPVRESESSHTNLEVGKVTARQLTYIPNSKTNLTELGLTEKSPTILSQFPSAYTDKTARAEALTELIMMANAVGANAWQLDEARSVELRVISKEGQLKEYELPRPHEGILLLMFPRVAFDGKTEV